MLTSVHLWRPRLNVTSQEVCGGGGGGAYLFRGHAINYGKSPKRLMYDGDPASPAHGHTHKRTPRKCIYISYEYVLPKASIPVSKLLVEIGCQPLLYLHHAVKIALVTPLLSVPLTHTLDSDTHTHWALQ